MINRFALSFLCIELDRDEMYGVTFVYILLLCANGSTGIIINIDAISNINLKAGMCHMEVDWFITYII